MNAQLIDFISAIVFVVGLGIFLILKRKNLQLQSLVRIGKFPIIFVLLMKTKWGLKFMDKMATRHRESIKLFGLISIGVGFVGMLLGIIYVVVALSIFLFKPQSQAANVALILPFTNIPGMGYLSFWHFLISLFIIALVHEFAHGIVARAHDIKVTSSGFGVLSVLIPIFPLAFVEPDEKSLPKKPDYVQHSVFAAGPVINIALAIICMLLVSFVFVPIEGALTEPKGFTYNTINSSYPAHILPNSTITGLNGRTIDTYTDFYEGMRCVVPGETIEIETYNGSYSITPVPSPDDPEKGFIGITPIQNERRIKAGYEISGPIFGWLKQLFIWLMNLNLAIGFVNLLPLFIVDGGRMFGVAAEKIAPGKSNRIIYVVGMICLFVILFGLVKQYGPLLIGWISLLF